MDDLPPGLIVWIIWRVIRSKFICRETKLNVSNICSGNDKPGSSNDICHGCFLKDGEISNWNNCGKS
ncbi:unnamed protein product, partial [Vitis vinifera]|uniref:Uncharacterized protein n=1 Tax=Vitis vinifera TaxID=29760 RepID=D7U446_VITVI